MTRIMYDSASPAHIPATAVMVAGYVAPSRYAWQPSDWDRFPHAATVRITVAGSVADWKAASVIDIEGGAFSPASAREFTRQRNAFRPGTATVYVNRSNRAAVEEALKGLDYHIWLATLDGTKAVEDMTRVVAVQYTDKNGLYDESVVYDDRWHPAPAIAAS